jgi:hypothetical protein
LIWLILTVLLSGKSTIKVGDPSAIAAPLPQLPNHLLPPHFVAFPGQEYSKASGWAGHLQVIVISVAQRTMRKNKAVVVNFGSNPDNRKDLLHKGTICRIGTSRLLNVA